MKVRIKKLDPKAIIPKYAHSTDAGLDMTATSKRVDENGCIVYGTGLAIEIPEGHVGLLFPRSSIAKYNLALSNAVGCVDAGFRGEITFKFRPSLAIKNYNGKEVTPHTTIGVTGKFTDYEIGDRIGQLIILPFPKIEFEEVEELSESERNTGGYGSTGR